MTTDAIGGQIEVLWHNAQVLIQKISADVQRVVAMPEIRDRILADASEPVGNRPDEYAVFIQSEIAKWRVVIKQANMKPD